MSIRDTWRRARLIWKLAEYLAGSRKIAVVVIRDYPPGSDGWAVGYRAVNMPREPVQRAATAALAAFAPGREVVAP